MDPSKQHDYELQAYNIKKASREILLFVDHQEFLEKRVRYGKAIQINISAQIGMIDSEIFTLGVRTKNNASIKMNVYCYSVLFDHFMGADNIRGAEFLLQNAYSAENIEDFDLKFTSRPYVGIYNKDFSSDQDRVMSVKDMFFNNSSIPLPIYYTQEQQKRNENDSVTIAWLDYPITYEGHQLIDRNTNMTIHDINAWDSMIDIYFTSMDNIKKLANAENTINIIGDMFVPSVQPILSGFAFIYDTEEKCNIQKIPNRVHIPMVEFRQKSQMYEDLDDIMNNIKYQAHHLEKEHGSVHIYYMPLLFGDKMQIEFKDYLPDNQPDCYQKTSIDKGISAKDYLAREYDEINMLNDDGE